MARIILWLLIVAVSPALYAESPTAQDFAGRIDLEVPQSAGFALLGVTPDKVIEPQSGRDFGAALLQGLDGDGNLQAGFALETRPYLWKQRAYIEEQDKLGRLLSGFKVSLATTTGLDDEDKANRYGIGINFSYRFNDPLLNNEYVNCIKGADDVVPRIPTGQKAEIMRALLEAVTDCQKKHISWASSAIALGIAANRADEDEMGLSESGFGAWVTGSRALGKNAEIVGHLRYVDNQLAVTNGVLMQTDTTVVAARFRFGGDSLRGVLEASQNDEKTDAGHDDFTLVSVGVEFKVSRGVWFRFAYGDTFGSSTDKEEFFAGQLRFGFGGRPVSEF